MTPILSAAILDEADRQPASSLGIVADGRLSVAALEALILRDPAYRVAQRARGIEQIREALLEFAPALLVVESRGLAWRAIIGSSPSSTPHVLLLLDPEDDPGQFVQAVRARANGYLSRTASRNSFLTALEHLRQGGYYLDPLLVERILRVSRDLGATDRVTRAELSQRETDILVGIATGRSSKEIAREYAITAKTVANHVHNIYRKLKLRHRGELVLYAAREGLAALPEATLA
jgi:DNA-binding NarL/FixJ family response regulator